MSSPNRIPIAERIVQQLRKRIITGFYSPHSYLPPERTLAREFGTSRTTVSTALAALGEEGLVMQTRGRGTRVLPPTERISSRPIAVIHHCGPRNQVWPESMRIMEGVQETFLRLEYPYRMLPILEDSLDIADLAKRYGAILIVEASAPPKDILALEEQRIPLVVANLETDLDVSATCVDHPAIIREAVNTLVRFGHRRIAFAGREPECAFYAKAGEGYEAGLAAAGIPFDPSLIIACDNTNALSAYLGTEAILNLADPPTGIVAGRDVLARGVCRAVDAAGKVVGRDVSVIGFDDVSWPNEEPFLSTFREPCHELGAVAAEMLIDRIVNGRRPAEKRVLPAPFVLRRSAGPCHSPGGVETTG